MEHAHEFLMPHSVCLIADEALLWTMFFSNIAIAVAYMLIPLGLQILRPSLLAFDARVAELTDADPKGVAGIRRGLIVCSQTFILACGSTHVFNAVTMFFSFYYWSAVSHVTTAVISLAVAVAFLGAGYRLSR